MSLPTTQNARIIIIGYGNPGRCDDGLGPALAHAVKSLHLPEVAVIIDYQLNIEHSELISHFDIAVLADASVNDTEPFALRRITPKAEVQFTTHSVSPEAVLAMAGDLFNSRVVGFTLAVRGKRFDEFEESLSERARINLAEAVEFIRSAVHCGIFTNMIRQDRNQSVGS